LSLQKGKIMRSTVLIAGATVLLLGCSQQQDEAAVAKDDALANTIVAGTEKPAPASEDPSPKAGVYDDRGKQLVWIEKGKDAIKTKLRDPDSAQFRNVEFHAGGGVPLACGEVNGNNGFGGKAGYERFVAASDSIAVLESEMTSSADMDEVWNRFCLS
jgi:hypothetical protein